MEKLNQKSKVELINRKRQLEDEIAVIDRILKNGESPDNAVRNPEQMRDLVSKMKGIHQTASNMR